MGDQTRSTDEKCRPTLVATKLSRHNVVATAELLDGGLTKEHVAHLARIGFLHRRHQGVWVIGRPDLSFEGACLAAVLACGTGAAISHITAARLWGFRQSFGWIHVSGPRSLRGHPGLIVHRPRFLPPEDIVERDGIARTTVARTLLDMSPKTPVETIGNWIHEAGVQRCFDRREVWACCERRPHHRGTRRLLAALAVEVLPTRSGLEDAYLLLSRRAGLPTPLVNSHQWSGEAWEEVDFFYPSVNLIVETDGGRYHGSRWRQRRDAAKKARFEAIGRRFERVPELAIALDPDRVVAALATLGRPNASVGRVLRPKA